MAKFANVHSVCYFQTTDFTHLHQMSNLIDYIRSVYRIRGKDMRLMTLPKDRICVHISMINYFTKFRDDILQHTIDFKKIIEKSTSFEELTVFHLLSFMGKKGSKKGYAYENGIGAMSAEARMSASEKGYENGIGVVQAEDRMAGTEKGYENGIGACRPHRLVDFCYPRTRYVFTLSFCRHISNCALIKSIQQQLLTCRVCELSLSNVYANRQSLNAHAKRCDRYLGDGTCPKILPCCNRSSIEIMRLNEWRSTDCIANHIYHCGGTMKPPGKRCKTEDNNENANPNRLHE
jgi:hypothetical protein